MKAIRLATPVLITASFLTLIGASCGSKQADQPSPTPSSSTGTTEPTPSSNPTVNVNLGNGASASTSLPANYPTDKAPAMYPGTSVVSSVSDGGNYTIALQSKTETSVSKVRAFYVAEAQKKGFEPLVAEGQIAVNDTFYTNTFTKGNESWGVTAAVGLDGGVNTLSIILVVNTNPIK